MYVPSVNVVDDPLEVVALLRAAGVGHLVSAVGGDGGTALDATLVPFVVDDELSLARAHLARANPQWRAFDGRPVLLVVPVSDGYVSPAWYPSKTDDPRVVPTWNYEVVHVHATAHARDDARFTEQVVRDLTEHNEAHRVERDPGSAAWAVDDAPADFVERQLRAIVGIELRITRVDAKRKLGQNRGAADRLGVAAGLDRSHTHGNRLSTAMRSTVAPGD